MEKIILSNETVADLYKKNLVLIDDQLSDHPSPPTPYTSLPSAILHTGGYQKKILWIHEEPNRPFLSDEDHEMITKILEACKFSWKDIALVNISGITADLKELLKQYSPKNLIISVNYKTQLPEIHNNLYSLSHNAQMSVLATDRLEQIRNDKNLKIKLWNALKQLFEL